MLKCFDFYIIYGYDKQILLLRYLYMYWCDEDAMLFIVFLI